MIIHAFLEKFKCAFVACMLAVFTLPAFSAGLPSIYTELEYLEGTGTQYIDTNVVPTVNTGAYIRASLPAMKSNDNVIFGATDDRAYANGKPFSIDVFPSQVLFTHGIKTGTTYNRVSMTGTYAVNTVYDFYLNYLNSRRCSIGTKNLALDSGEAMTKKSLYFFGLNNSGGGMSSYAPTNMRLYKAVLTESGEITHNYVPVRRNDDVLGLYDTVGNTFLTNRGSGTFTAGPVVGIKVATKNYVTNEFAPVKSFLTTTNTIVDGVVTQSNTNTTNIGTLAAEKQNRPNSSCPSGRKCLLVKDEQGNDNWYPIIEQ